MPNALIFSSFVASSRVGGVIQTLALGALGVEAQLIPTVLFGRHPGLGAPGGGAVGPATFAGVLEGAEAQGALQADLILTGYFALAEQVEMTAAAIERAKVQALKPIILVDPILGDEDSGLYVKPEVEAAVRGRLAPLADVLAPNLWELRRITGRNVTDPEGAAAAARSLGRPALVSGVPCGADQIGALYVDEHMAWLASHAKAVAAPKGAGDLLKALFAAGLIHGGPVQTLLARAVGGVADAIERAVAAGLDDLCIVALPDRLKAPLSRITLSTVA